MQAKLASDADVLDAIERFCAVHKMAITAFGREAFGDSNLVPQLRDGRSLTLKSAERLVRFMDQHEADLAGREAA